MFDSHVIANVLTLSVRFLFTVVSSVFKAFLLDFVHHFCFFLCKDQNVSEIVLFPDRENVWSNEFLGLSL